MKKILVVITAGFLIVSAIFAQCDNCKGQWIGEIVKDGKKWKTELNISVEEDHLKGYFDVPDYGLYHLVFDTVYLADNKIHLKYEDKNTKVNFNGTIAGKMMTGDWEGLETKATFSLQKMNDQPIEYKIEEVYFTNNESKLAGTLIIPLGKGPFPAVVHVHGSGNQTRTEEFYLSRAYLFAKNGIATLIYDRRGKGASTGSDVSMELLADDAIEGVHFLQRNNLIEKNKIGIMGFSQGGYIGPLAAIRSKDIAFLIAGSAPGVTPDYQNDFNVENKLRKLKVTEDTIAYVLNFRKDLREYQYSGIGDKSELSEGLDHLKTKSWFRSTLLTDEAVQPASPRIKDFLTFNPLPVWERVHVPVLLFWGELDNLVPVEISKIHIETALKKSGNKDYTIKTYANSSHGIEVINNTEVWDWPRLAEGYHDFLVNWTLRVLVMVMEQVRIMQQ